MGSLQLRPSLRELMVMVAVIGVNFAALSLAWRSGPTSKPTKSASEDLAGRYVEVQVWEEPDGSSEPGFPRGPGTRTPRLVLVPGPLDDWIVRWAPPLMVSIGTIWLGVYWVQSLLRRRPKRRPDPLVRFLYEYRSRPGR